MKMIDQFPRQMIFKKKAIILIFSLFSILGLAQSTKPDKQNIQVATDTEPSFPKGDNELYQYVLLNLNWF